jgi:heptosyltransferase-2
VVAQTAFLGDAVLGLSVVQALESAFAPADVRYLVRKGNESLVPGAVFVWDKRRDKWNHFRQTLTEIRRFAPEVFVNIQRFFSSGLMTVLSGAKITVGFDKNPLSAMFTHRVAHVVDGRHELERNAELLKALGVERWERPRIRMEDPGVDGRYVVLAPTTVWATKTWAHWTALARLLAERVKVYVVGAPDERDACQIVAGDHAENLAGALSLPQLAGLMKRAARVFVNDSAPLHIAGAVNAPVTAMFCSTVPAFGFGPISDDAIVLDVNGLECRPCGLHGKKRCPLGHFRCGRDILPHTVAATLSLS